MNDGGDPNGDDLIRAIVEANDPMRGMTIRPPHMSAAQLRQLAEAHHTRRQRRHQTRPWGWPRRPWGGSA